MCTPAPQPHAVEERKYEVMILNISDREIKPATSLAERRAGDKEKEAGRINAVCSHRGAET